MNLCNLICGVNYTARGWLLMNTERILQPFVLEEASWDAGKTRVPISRVPLFYSTRARRAKRKLV